jgi:hypothetical protein
VINWLMRVLFGKKIEELNRIEKALNDKLSEVNTVYTTIKIFSGIDTSYYSWLCGILKSEEYRYLLFDLRENVLRDMVSTSDKEQIMRNMGRLDMIGIIDNYINRYKIDYENSIRRNTEVAKK